MRDITVRTYGKDDKEILDDYRLGYLEADLELPHGYEGAGMETVVSEKDGKVLSSVTGTLAVILDPLIKDPEAKASDVLQALFKQEAVLAVLGMKSGAVDSFVAIPKQLEGYIRLLEKCGYKASAEHCVIMRRPLRPDTEPLIGPLRDEVIKDITKS
jgi:hypothetical protein